MKYSRLGALILWGTMAACNQQQSVNVNSRYTVEKIEIAGASEATLSETLREDLRKLVGEKFNQEALAEVAKRVRKELHARSVTQKLTRGDRPEHVIVILEVTRPKSMDLDLSSGRVMYHARQGWSGGGEFTTAISDNRFGFGLVDDGDQLTERYAGMTARYENKKLGTDRLRLAFLFENYHTQWNLATLDALDRAGAQSEIYRTRQNFEPTVMLVVLPSVTVGAGASFERFQEQFSAAHTGTANSVVTTLRYHRQLEGSDTNKQVLDAGYTLRAATRVFGSDFVYARHLWDAEYSLTHGNNALLVNFVGGTISGHAPLFERYTLGNSSTLRGWNKYEIAPLGGNRVVHNTVEYRYRFFQAFYDTGAVWNNGENAVARHSAGVGLRLAEFALYIGFPIRSGRVEPIFMVGMNLD